MKKQIKARTPLRGRLTTLVNETTALLAAPLPDKKLLKINSELMKDVHEEIELLNQKISEILINADADDGDIEAEYEECDRNKKSYLMVMQDIEILLTPATVTEDEGVSKKRSFKLPTVELRTFNGDLKQWLSWWSQFSKIHEDDELNNTDKFQYLCQAMEPGSEARDLVEMYPQTAGNYDKAIEALTDRFGRQDLLLQVYVRELLTLVITNVTNKEKIPLSNLYFKLESQLRALSALNLDKADPATWLFPLVESSLSADMLRAWQRSPQSKEDGSQQIPPRTRLDILMDFIKLEVHSEQQISLAQSSFQMHSTEERKKGGTGNKGKKIGMQEEPATAAGLISTQSSGCAFCDDRHDTDRCVKALSMTIEDRRRIVKEKRLCFKCLKTGHNAKRCRATVQCAVCNGRHYPIVCQGKIIPNKDNGNSVPVKIASDQPKPSFQMPAGGHAPGDFYYATSTFNSNQCTTDVLLNTLKVRMVGGDGALTVRIVGDTGSQRSYIRRTTVERGKCRKVGEEWLRNILFGGKLTEPQCNGRYTVGLQRLDGTNTKGFELLAREEICGQLSCVPHGPWIAELKSKGIPISDQGNGYQNVDILLGNDYWGSILTGRMVWLSSGLIATETIFGWTLGGRIPQVSSTNMGLSVISMMAQSDDISNLWSLESIGIHDPIEVTSKKVEEQIALQSFNKTVKRDEIGRYVVCLPWKCDKVKLPTNRTVAEKRLRSATYKLKKNGKFEAYNNVFKFWELEGFIKRVPDDICIGHYLPHRPVFKDSATTPVRPVFDASAKCGNGPSLNDLLYKGPNLLELIPTLLFRFREKQVGVTADIRKAFQMVGVNEDDKTYQKFLWWEDDTCERLIVYQHERVVFGMNCSPFLLGAAINHHLSNVKEMQNVACKLLSNFYVDNCVTSVRSKEEFEDFRSQATQLMAAAKMELRQWAFSLSNVIGVDPHSGCRLINGDDLSIENSSCISVLGLAWDREADTLSCDVKDFENGSKITKRSILSTVAQIFDPVGITSPAVLQPKLLLQDTWIRKLGWDEALPEEIEKKFLAWVSEVKYLKELKLQRHFTISESSKDSVHVFCDASQFAYGAVVFRRSEESDIVKVRFLMAKSRLAPIRKSTIPRLELMACLIGVRIGNLIREATNCKEVPFHYWSDSTTALSWIGRRGEWGTFVSNRCQEILSKSENKEWKHVPGIHNPADLASRGCSPKKLLDSSWLEGPSWLKLRPDQWPISQEVVDEEEVAKELKKTSVLVSFSQPIEEPRFSSYIRNVSIWGWVLRFIGALKRSHIHRGKYLTIDEIRSAEKVVLKEIQRSSFPNPANHVDGIVVHKDDEGLLRVVTRLSYRKDKADFVSPVLLPKSHPMVILLIQDVHRHNGHAGIQFLMCKLREKYWIPQSRRTIRKVLRRCAICRRFEASSLGVDPAPLPEKRVKDSEPFETTGVDLAGPLCIKDGSKVWIVLFTCAVYRCVYLDLVQSLSTEAFLASLERFVSVYGRPNTIYSDNGTNFVGAANVFRMLNWKEVERAGHLKQIQFVRIPATTAWWGGWWERLVRSVKDLLKRMLGKSRLTYDELRTCLCGVAATINDRPLTVLNEDLDDLIPLTPSMFLRWRMGEIPETLTATSLRDGYSKMKNLQSQLQDRFRREYLAQLVMKGNERKQESLSVGDVVLVGSDNRKRFDWPLGLVLELIPGRDGKARIARVKTNTGIFVRPLQRLFPLEISSHKEDPSSIREKGVIVKVMPRESNAAKESEKLSTEIVTSKGRIVKRPSRYGQWLHIVNYVN